MPHLITELVAATSLVCTSGVVALVIYRDAKLLRKPPVRPAPDYTRIADLEKELGIGSPLTLLPIEHYRGMDAQHLHLALDALWRRAQRDDSPELRQQIDELVEQYGRVLEDEQDRRAQ